LGSALAPVVAAGLGSGLVVDAADPQALRSEAPAVAATMSSQRRLFSET
jgi:hypothetical protein